jgi:hypothetical protein
MSEQKLVLYDQMRIAIQRCAEIDEAAAIRDKAAQLEAYARIRDDITSERKCGEIRLRAIRKIGELSQGLDKAQGRRTDLKLSDNDVAKSKSQQLADAGINKRTAERYEQLAGPREEQAQQAANAAADLYFAEQQEKAEPVTAAGLQTAIDTALVPTFGKSPKRRKKPKKVIDHRFIQFIRPIRDFQRKRAEYDAAFFAEEEREADAKSDVETCAEFSLLIEQFIQKTKERFSHLFEEPSQVTQMESAKN